MQLTETGGVGEGLGMTLLNHKFFIFAFTVYESNQTFVFEVYTVLIWQLIFSQKGFVNA